MKHIKKRITQDELEEKIWNVCSVEIPSLAEIWAKVGGNRNLCFAKVKEMIERYDLKKTDEGNYVRVDSTKKEEFEFGFTFQVNLLKQCRDDISSLKKPLFGEKSPGKEQIIQMTKNVIERYHMQNLIKFSHYKPSNQKVITALETMLFYLDALLIFISRSNLQGSLNLISKAESQRRIKKCENAISLHFKKLRDDNPNDSEGIRYYFKENIYKIENFKIA